MERRWGKVYGKDIGQSVEREMGEGVMEGRSLVEEGERE